MTEDESLEWALSQPLDPERFRPTDLHLDKKDGLRIEWADGHASHYPLAYLRKHCPCATCRVERQEKEAKSASTSLTVLPANIGRAAEFTDARLMGNYAMQIDWADGHKTGIYDFRYLRAICPSDRPGWDEPKP